MFRQSPVDEKVIPVFRRCLWLILLLGVPGLLPAQVAPDLRVLPADFNSDLGTQMMRSYLRTRVHAALDQRLENLEALDSEKSIRAYQKRVREVFLKSIGPLPERTPLNARVTGTLTRDNFHIENILFESQPGFFVTGNLYLPNGLAVPRPGILLPCGHSKNGKAYDSYQRAAILLAQNGFVVFCFDPIGQGERHQFLDSEGRPINGGSGEHQALGVAPILVGRGLATYFIWDGMRALDYLASRPEVDATRLGCTGNSGGGNLTAMLMALDDRIQAAAPGCFMATTRTKNEKPGPGDAEQNLFGQIHDGLDHPDFAIQRAPKPTLILAATRDFVPIDGTWQNFRQAKRVYTKLGRPEAMQLIEAREKHGFSRLLREGAVRFFSRSLLGRMSKVIEPDQLPVATDAEIQVTPDGEVLRLEGARSLLAINEEFYQRQRQGVPEDDGEFRRLVREITGIETGKASTTRTAKPKEEANRRSVLIFTPEDGIVLPAYRTGSEGSQPPGEIHLLVHDLGIGNTADQAHDLVFADGKRPENYTILGVDLRDIGETKTRNWRFYGADAAIAHMLGDSYLAMRAEDIISLARFESDLRGGKKVHLHAWGELVAPAMHAAALEPDLFASTNFHGGAKWHSWLPLLKEQSPTSHVHTVVYGALLHYDLTDLLPLIPNAKLLP
jgi:dienelactone hydrolase